MATRDESKTPWMATHPGVILKYELEERGISQKDFAAMIGVQKSHLNELIKGKRPMTKPLAEKIGKALGISAVSLVNMQTQYDYDKKVIEQRGLEELEAQDKLAAYDTVFDVKTVFKRLGVAFHTAAERARYISERLRLPQPAELRLETAGLFRKSAKTGQDPRMLMTWKILAEAKAREQKVSEPFDRNKQGPLVKALAEALHTNKATEETVRRILSSYGIAFCVVGKVEKASVDGYSFMENGVPYVILTKRFDRIDNFAFALMHEIGHVFLHYQDEASCNGGLSIPDYDNESKEEKEANAFAANSLIPDDVWADAPKVRLNPFVIQRQYTRWAEEKGLNEWIVLGRISHETGMYKFRSDDGRRIG